MGSASLRCMRLRLLLMTSGDAIAPRTTNVAVPESRAETSLAALALACVVVSTPEKSIAAKQAAELALAKALSAARQHDAAWQASRKLAIAAASAVAAVFGMMPSRHFRAC